MTVIMMTVLEGILVQDNTRSRITPPGHQRLSSSSTMSCNSSHRIFMIIIIIIIIVIMIIIIIMIIKIIMIIIIIIDYHESPSSYYGWQYVRPFIPAKVCNWIWPEFAQKCFQRRGRSQSGGKSKIIRGLLQSRDYWEMHRMNKYICLLVESFWCKSGKSKIMVGVSHSLLPIQWMTRIPHRAPQDPEDFVPEWHNPGFVVIWLTQHRICYLKKNTGYMLNLCIP